MAGWPIVVPSLCRQRGPKGGRRGTGMRRNHGSFVFIGSTRAFGTRPAWLLRCFSAAGDLTAGR
jgi:hypothetical protein